MTTHVLVNKLGLTHKGSIGVSTATLPDVCKTPSPGGPVPIPYPNVSMCSSLTKGTKTVSIKNSKMVAIKGSEYASSTGDEPGTAGGVKSSTFKKESTWISYSFDVKFESKNVCRHTDKKFQNHQNTADLAGNVDPQVVKLLQDMVCECDRKGDTEQAKRKAAKKKQMSCRQLGEWKHDCCNKAIDAHNDAGGAPKLQGEKGYDRTTGQIVPGATRKWGTGMTPAQYFKSISGKIFPDAAVLSPAGNVENFVEFKFQCPGGTKTRKGARKSAGTAVQGWTPGRKGKPGQLARTLALGALQNPPAGPPELLSNEDCQ